MTTTGKTQTKRTMLTAVIAVAAAVAALAAGTSAQAQSTTCCTTGGVFMPPVTTPTPPTNPTIPPPVVTTTIPTTPPPVVVTRTPTPTPMPDRPGMFTNVPSDMRRLMQFDTVSSIDRLLTSPAAVSLSLPRQAVPNKLENRLPSLTGSVGAKPAGGAEDAAKALENAKPLI
ncbi:MAG: hypothetical protein L6R19_01765 [Alphaproteobacteria bacterium]|nr:hypothetical protein [Alphaproteobacteria bacterium]